MRLKCITLIRYSLFLLASSFAAANQVRIEPITPLPTITIENSALAELGKQLFQDVRFSSDKTTSCASCHRLDQAGVDNLSKSTGVNGRQGIFNTPSVFNSSLNIKQFWNGRADTLVDQMDFPIQNAFEMDSSWSNILAVVKNDPDYKTQFKTLFSDGITQDNIKAAIVYFEQTLMTPNSRFDRYLNGDDSMLTPDELAGYSLFKQYGCIACHQGMAIGGNMFQKIGIMKPYFVDTISPEDLGRFTITKAEADKFVFKVPSLRNVALTAPYLHNGSIETLNEVVKIMMTYQLGVDAPDEDIDLIVRFLKTLSGEYNGMPL